MAVTIHHWVLLWQFFLIFIHDSVLTLSRIGVDLQGWSVDHLSLWLDLLFCKDS